MNYTTRCLLLLIIGAVSAINLEDVAYETISDESQEVIPHINEH